MKNLKKVSRWIAIETLNITEKHTLFYYADADTEENGKRLVSAFRYKNRWYALGQFISRFGMFGFDLKCDEYPGYICGYDAEGNIFNPLLIEMDLFNEKIRLWLAE